jgi:hypothetical protein
VRLKGKHPGKQITITDIGNPHKVKLVVGDTLIVDDAPFPIKWSDRCFMVAGERQDMSLKTQGASGNRPELTIHCKQLTHEAQLYLDDELVLLISPPLEAEVFISGDLELDGDPVTFDGSFQGKDEIGFKGKLPKNFDPAKRYQRINTSGEPALQMGDRFGDFEIAGFAEHYDDWRITALEFSYDGFDQKKINVYQDAGRKHLVASYEAYPGDYFTVDVGYIDGDRVYLEDGKKHDAITLTGKRAAEIGDRFLDCTLLEFSRIPLGPPHYVELILEYTGRKAPLSLTAYDGRWKDVIGSYAVDPAVTPIISIDGRELPKGHLGEFLVLESGYVEAP